MVIKTANSQSQFTTGVSSISAAVPIPTGKKPFEALNSPFLNRKLKRKISEPHTDQIKVTDNVATPRHTTLSTWNAATAKSNPRAPVRLSKPYFMVKTEFVLTLSRLQGKLLPYQIPFES